MVLAIHASEKPQFGIIDFWDTILRFLSRLKEETATHEIVASLILDYTSTFQSGYQVTFTKKWTFKLKKNMMESAI